MPTFDTKAWRKQTFDLLDSGADERSLGNRLLGGGLILLILLNAVAVILESVPEIYLQLAPAFNAFDIFSVAIFSVEYVARVWSSVEAHHPPPATPWERCKIRARYMVSPLAVIDLVAIFPFFLQWALPTDLKVLRMLRLMRAFKLTRYFTALSLLLEVLRQEIRSIGAALSILGLVMLLSASLAYVFEHPVQPHVFPHIPAAMYWAVITLTTVGYGDMVPITAMGKLLGAVIAIIGVGMVALPAGILASAFSEKLRRSRQRYEEEVSAALSNGLITHAEKSQLENLREELGLSTLDAEAILRAEVENRKDTGKTPETLPRPPTEPDIL
ncbi:MAG: ion transporter [Rhodospirillaceae bacterium]|nr:ion transporter [Rhodospirillaceae bacterium]